MGEHLRRARLDRGLPQRQVAAAIGCHHASLLNWERGRAEPKRRYLPGILRFLGYDPRPLAAVSAATQEEGDGLAARRKKMIASSQFPDFLRGS
ncbi:MAG TPA: helix-turn-helix transcriptional regulator [Thermoanaerobaculia bacterium]|nr:helix-turn-helix transcriptional regulator [Thermoanaerobaculia bacterium]